MLCDLYTYPEKYTFRFTFDGDTHSLTHFDSVYRDGDFLRIIYDRFVVVIPTTSECLERLKGVAKSVSFFNTTMFARCGVLSVGIFGDDGNFCSVVDSLVYRRREGVTLSDYLSCGVNSCDISRFYGALSLFEEELHRCGVSVVVATDDIIVDIDGYLYVRYIDTITLGDVDLSGLRSVVESSTGVLFSDVELCFASSYPTSHGCMVCGYEVCGYPHEGRIRVSSGDGLYGFVDESGDVVVAPRYEWVEDYVEGRSVVTLDGEVLRIDLWGEVILEGNLELAGTK